MRSSWEVVEIAASLMRLVGMVASESFGGRSCHEFVPLAGIRLFVG